MLEPALRVEAGAVRPAHERTSARAPSCWSRPAAAPARGRRRRAGGGAARAAGEAGRSRGPWASAGAPAVRPVRAGVRATLELVERYLAGGEAEGGCAAAIAQAGAWTRAVVRDPATLRLARARCGATARRRPPAAALSALSRRLPGGAAWRGGWLYRRGAPLARGGCRARWSRSATSPGRQRQDAARRARRAHPGGAGRRARGGEPRLRPGDARACRWWPTARASRLGRARRRRRAPPARRAAAAASRWSSARTATRRGASPSSAPGDRRSCLDDGFQNRTIDKDLEILVVNGARAMGQWADLPARHAPRAAARAAKART